MTIYEFEAIENYEGAKVIDRYRIEASSFAEACSLAEYEESIIALENDREPTVYDEFKQIKR
jgi:hypothetical protein